MYPQHQGASTSSYQSISACMLQLPYPQHQDEKQGASISSYQSVSAWLLLLPLSCAPRCSLSSCCSSTQGPTEPPGGAAILLTR